MTTTNNMDVWSHACKTDIASTKTVQQGGRTITSISTLWPIKKATELWGPMGLGWGVNIIEERYDTGIPITKMVKKDANDKNEKGEEVFICDSKIHTLRIELWYTIGNSTGRLTSFGHTPYIYSSKWGASQDDEAPKKSLSDAIKKALSMLGFSADIYMGLFDDRDYMESLKAEQGIAKSENKAEAEDSAKAELIDYVKRNLESIDKALTKSEATGIFRSMDRHLKHRISLPLLAEICEKGIEAASNKTGEKIKQLEDAKNV